MRSRILFGRDGAVVVGFSGVAKYQDLGGSSSRRSPRRARHPEARGGCWHRGRAAVVSRGADDVRGRLSGPIRPARCEAAATARADVWPPKYGTPGSRLGSAVAACTEPDLARRRRPRRQLHVLRASSFSGAVGFDVFQHTQWAGVLPELIAFWGRPAAGSVVFAAPTSTAAFGFGGPGADLSAVAGPLR